MRSASGAKHFVAIHPEAVICGRDNISRNERLAETGPTGAGFEFSIAGEKRSAATDATKDAATMLEQEHGRTSPLGHFAPQDCKLNRGQLFLPFGVRFYDLGNKREILRGRQERRLA